MTMTEVHTPRVLWAQRRDRVFVTVEVADAKADSVKVELTGDSLALSAKSGSGEEYAVKVDFFGPIDAGASQQNLSGRYPTFVLIKADNEPTWWPRLIKSTGKPHYIHTDFAKWVDEDDLDDDAGLMGEEDDGMMMGGGGGNFDMSQFMSQYHASHGSDDGDDDENAEDFGSSGDEDDKIALPEESVKEVDLEAERAKFKGPSQ